MTVDTESSETSTSESSADSDVMQEIKTGWKRASNVAAVRGVYFFRCVRGNGADPAAL